MATNPESPLQVALDPDSSPPTMKTLEGMYSLPLPLTLSFMNLSNMEEICISVEYHFNVRSSEALARALPKGAHGH